MWKKAEEPRWTMMEHHGNTNGKAKAGVMQKQTRGTGDTTQSIFIDLSHLMYQQSQIVSFQTNFVAYRR